MISGKLYSNHSKDPLTEKLRGVIEQFHEKLGYWPTELHMNPADFAQFEPNELPMFFIELGRDTETIHFWEVDGILDDNDEELPVKVEPDKGIRPNEFWVGPLHEALTVDSPPYEQ